MNSRSIRRGARAVVALWCLAGLTAAAFADTVLAWGGNISGERDVPAGLTGVKQVDGASFHAVALKNDGTVVAWGSNIWGESVVPAGLTGVVQVVAGDNHCLALKSDGTVVGWGWNGWGQTALPAGTGPVTQIAAGSSHDLALKPDGTVVAWGYNAYGQSTVPAGLANVVQVECGQYTSYALKSDGTVVAWGMNTQGQATVPAGLTGVVKIAAGERHCLALKSDGTVVAWGYNSAGQCNVPAGLTGVTGIAAGGSHSIALRSTGTITSWGANTSGQRTPPAGLSGVLQVASSTVCSYAVVRGFDVFLDQSHIATGGSATGTVSNSVAAPSGGTTVMLSASNGLLQVPASVTIPSGQTKATFPVFTPNILGPGGTTTVSATSGTSTVTTDPITVTGVATTLTIAATPGFAGGTKDVATATISVAAPFSTDTTAELVSSDAMVSVPATVTIPAGATSILVPITAGVVPSDRDVTLTLNSVGTVAATATFTVRSLDGSVSVDTLNLNSGQTAQGTVGLNGKVLSPLTVSLSSSDPAVSVPASVTIPAGSNRVYFPVQAVGAGPASATITATINGHIRTTSLYVQALPQISAVTIAPVAYGWTEVPVRIDLTAPAPVGGARVRLTTSDLALKVPSYVTVPEGATFIEFIANTENVAATTSSTLTAEIGSSTASASVDVHPLAVTSITIAPGSTVGGSDVQVTVQLNAVPNRNVVVSLSYTGPRKLVLPSGTTVLKGTDSRTITVGTNAVTSDTTLVVTVSYNGSTASQNLVLTH